MSRLGGLLALLVAMVALAGCSLTGARPGGGSACAAQFTAARCDAMLLWAADQLEIEPGRIDRVDIGPPMSPPGPMNPDAAVQLVVGLAGGGTREITLHCFGIPPPNHPCMLDPEVRVYSAAGDRDVPEGSSPIPELEPSAVAAARPLELDRLVIPVAKAGGQRVSIGHVALANGVVQEFAAELEDTWPNNVLVRGDVEIQLLPVGGGGRIGNAYVQGWRPGVQEVEVVVFFDAAIVRPGAELVLVDVVVR